MNGTMRDQDGQVSMFDGTCPLHTDKPIRLIELFAGIGAQAKAMENLGANFEHYRICEFDKYAVRSYNAVHGTNFETSDITKIHSEDIGIVDTDKYFYIMTYSFPCTDLSIAGKQKGMSRGSGTRSGLLWEVERLLKEIVSKGGELPQMLLMENVRDVISDKFVGDFYEWCDFLEGLGYNSKYDLLNAKDYGIPQNRMRCFMVSWLGDYYYDFPDKIPLKLRLKDMLEDKVEEKYYISTNMIQLLHCEQKNDIGCNQIGVMEDYGSIDQAKRFYDTNGLTPAITSHANDTLPKIAVEITDCGKKLTKEIDVAHALCARDYKGLPSREGNGVLEPLAYDEQNERLHTDGTVGTLTCDGNSPKHNNRVVEPINYRIRKLTPRETWRLMGFDDADFDKAQKVNSSSQLYKEAGNSIVVQVLMAILKEIVV